MTLYDPVNQTAQCLDAREVAPIAATKNMFRGKPLDSQKGPIHFFTIELNPRVEKIHLVALCTYMAGGLAVAVPGELAGYWAAHQQYGKLNWSRLVLPTAEMVEKGIPVNSHLANSLQEFQKLVIDEPSMR